MNTKYKKKVHLNNAKAVTQADKSWEMQSHS